MKRMAILGLLALAASTLAQTTAIVGATIVIRPGEKIESGYVAWRDGRIVSVGPMTNLPDNLGQIDGKGLTVYAGFIDTFSTSGLKAFEAQPAATARPATNTAPSDMWLANRRGIRAQLQASQNVDLSLIRDAAHQNGLVGGAHFPAGNTVSGQGAIVWYGTQPMSESFGMAVSFRGGGGGPGGGGGGGYPGSLMGVIAHLRQFWADAARYAQQASDPADPDLAAAAPFVGGSRPVVALADTEAEILRAFRLSDEFNLKIAVQGGREAEKRMAELRRRQVPVLLATSIPSAPGQEVTPDGPPKAVLEERLATWKDRVAMAVRLASSDLAVGFSSQGDGVGSYLANARKLVAAGLKADDALRSMTTGGAKALGLDRTHGEVANGKAATLTVMTGNWESSESKVKMVIVNGEVIEVKTEGGAK